MGRRPVGCYRQPVSTGLRAWPWHPRSRSFWPDGGREAVAIAFLQVDSLDNRLVGSANPGIEILDAATFAAGGQTAKSSANLSCVSHS